MAKADPAKIDVKGLREREQLKAILQELGGNSADKVEINPLLAGELRSFIDTKTLIPTRIEVADRRSVNQAQEALAELQGRVDRVLAIQSTVFKVKQALGKLEILVVKDLAEAGVITGKSTGAATKLMLGIVMPELAVIQQKWVVFEKFCLSVQNHLGDAKDTIRMQIKLDENANWNRRYSGMGS